MAETLGEDRPGSPEEELDEVRVVDVEIQQGPAGGRAVKVGLLSPRGWLADPAETRGADGAVAAVGDRLPQPRPTGPEAQAHRRHKLAASRSRRGHKFTGLRRGPRERLLAQHVLAGAQGPHRQGHVRRGGHAEIDQIDGRIGQDVLQIPGDPDPGHIQFEGLPAGDVARDPGEIPVRRGRPTAAAKGRDPHSGNLKVGLQVGDAHKAEPDDGDVDHRVRRKGSPDESGPRGCPRSAVPRPRARCTGPRRNRGSAAVAGRQAS